MAKKKNTLGMIAWVLCTIAALEIGLAAFGWGVLGMLGGLTKIAGIIIGLGGLYSLYCLVSGKKCA